MSGEKASLFSNFLKKNFEQTKKHRIPGDLQRPVLQISKIACNARRFVV